MGVSPLDFLFDAIDYWQDPEGWKEKPAYMFPGMIVTPVSGTTFTRRVGEQLHFVGLQFRRFSSEITFNLGCHFVGIPSMFDFQPVAADDLEQLDCGLRCRIGNYIGDGLYDVWWDPDNSEVPGALAQASWATERAFDDCIKKWGGDGMLLLERHVTNRSGAIRLSKPLFRWMWPQRQFDRFGFVALLAHQHGQQTLARSLYEKAVSCDDVIPAQVPQLSALLKMQQPMSSETPAKRTGRKVVRRSKKR